MHRLLERLPELAPGVRSDAARKWLAQNAPDFAADDREAMLTATLGIVGDPGWSELFGQGSLAEVPFSAVVGGQVVAGTVDRLLIGPDRVRVVDFKTARRPPTRLEDVPDATVRQMAAYAAALGVIYPGRAVEAAILYTATPLLLAVPQPLLDRYKPDLPRSE
jgi:ATP-dependent helicase/nuclease subunit A